MTDFAALLFKEPAPVSTRVLGAQDMHQVFPGEVGFQMGAGYLVAVCTFSILHVLTKDGDCRQHRT